MKRLMFGLAGLVIFCGLVQAGQDRFGNARPAVWRSSSTSTGELDAVIASGTVRLHGVRVNFPGLNSSVEFFNGKMTTATATSLFTVDTSSNTSQLDYDIVVTSGLAYQKKGAADITILWDWEGVPLLPNVGK